MVGIQLLEQNQNILVDHSHQLVLVVHFGVVVVDQEKRKQPDQAP